MPEIRATHRVALELEVVTHPEAGEPEDWELHHLEQALRAGVATPLRTIHGVVIDSEHDRLSRTLDAVADDLEEAVQLHWLASSKRWPSIARTLYPRPSIESLLVLERLAGTARQVAAWLRKEGL